MKPARVVFGFCAIDIRLRCIFLGVSTPTFRERGCFLQHSCRGKAATKKARVWRTLRQVIAADKLLPWKPNDATCTYPRYLCRRCLVSVGNIVSWTLLLSYKCSTTIYCLVVSRHAAFSGGKFYFFPDWGAVAPTPLPRRKMRPEIKFDTSVELAQCEHWTWLYLLQFVLFVFLLLITATFRLTGDISVSDSSIEAPPSFKPAKKYSDITGLPVSEVTPHVEPFIPIGCPF